jgi:hypothetical protein
MGFFSGIVKSVKSVVKAVAKPVVKVLPKAVAKPITQVATSLSKLTPSTLLKAASQGPVLGPINYVAGSTAPKIAPYVQLASSVASSFVNPTGATKMALNIGGILGSVGGILGNTNASGNPLISGLSGALQLAGQVIPTKSTAVAVNKAPAASSAVAVMGARGTALTQEVFNAGNKVLSRLGIRYSATTGGFTSALKRSLGSIASLARRTPAGTIVSILVGLGLTAVEANLLTAWHSQRRRGKRMNPANAKALRRAARRIRSFHKLCTHTDLLKSRGRSAGRSRCGTCRKSPCRC